MSEHVDNYDGDFRPFETDLALLGKVISEWGEVEFWLLVILRRLAGIEFNESMAIFGNIRNWRTITGALADLADEKIEAADAKLFKGLLKRFDKQAARRNRIVHASWYKSDSGDWCRYIVPSSESKIAKVLSSSPLDHKTRSRHLFRPNDLSDFCEQARCLQSDIMEFWDDWDHRQNPR